MQDPVSRESVILFLTGDVMTGRGIDQVLPRPGDPRLYEPHVRNATRYVELAEEANGPIPRSVPYSYVWGDALAELERVKPGARIVNLETTVTASDRPWPGKGIHYRMHPDNVGCLVAAEIDCCVLANNHAIDWGLDGLEETLTTLTAAGIDTAGAGRDAEQASAPALLEVGTGSRVLVFGMGSRSSGIPEDWAARPGRPGLDLLVDYSPRTLERVADRVGRVKSDGDIVVVSIHWGGNWGYSIPAGQREFARRLIDEAGVDVVHGHSSHHFKGIEIYRDHPILYGCGDFLTDYEGISGYERYRDDLVLMYFPSLAPSSGQLLSFELVPMRIRRFRLEHPSEAEVDWIRTTLNREGEPLGTFVEAHTGDALRLGWG